MKYKKIANMTLIILIIIFILLVFIKHFYGEFKGFNLIEFIVEASLVGSTADWLAVNALFKKIIPSSRKSIIKNASIAINEELLNYDFIKETVERIEIKEMIVNALDNKESRDKIEDFLRLKIMGFLNSIVDGRSYEDEIKRFLIESIDKSKTSRAAIKYFLGHFTRDTYETLMNKGIKYCGREEIKGYIKQLINSRINSQNSKGVQERLKNMAVKSNIINSEELAALIQEEAIEFLDFLKNNEYEEVVSSIGKYAESIKLSELKFDIMVNKFIEDMDINPYLINISEFLKNLIEESPKEINGGSEKGDFIDIILMPLDSLWTKIKTNDEVLVWIDATIKNVILDIIWETKDRFYEFIDETLNSFTDEKISELVESKAGNVLHWIRLNGAMLGGILGLIIFLIENYLMAYFIK